MGIHEWSYDNDIDHARRYVVPHADKDLALAQRRMEVELGFDEDLGYKEAMRCLNCDVQTVFTESLCIECDACVDVCPTDCITFTGNGEESDLRLRLTAPARNEGAGDPRLRPPQDRAGDGQGTRTCACTAGSAPSAARRAPGDMQKFLLVTAKACEHA